MEDEPQPERYRVVRGPDGALVEVLVFYVDVEKPYPLILKGYAVEVFSGLPAGDYVADDISGNGTFAVDMVQAGGGT